MEWCIAPTLCGIKYVKAYSDHEMGQTKANLVIKASLLIQILKERSIRRPTLKLHIRNFEIATVNKELIITDRTESCD